MKKPLHPGLYEQVINHELNSELQGIPADCQATAKIDRAEASKILAAYVADAARRELESVADSGGDLSEQIALANRMLSVFANASYSGDKSTPGNAGDAADTCNPERDLLVDEKAEQLLAVLRADDPARALGKKAGDLQRPETSIAQSSLFTGAVHEPQMYSELKKEILSADRIDMLVSFVKWSGLRLIMEELSSFTQKGGKLRIITTSYMGATDLKAIEELNRLPGTEIKVSYDTKRTRLHAKTWVFYRDTGFSTAYVGSSNLSNAAISSGLEWNVKVTAKDQPDTMRKIAATFDSYWNSDEFESYREEEKERLRLALKAERFTGDGNSRCFVFNIRPYPYQQEILDQLKAEREVRNRWRNLIVAATGTGKTVIAAFDYKDFCSIHPGEPCRLLFVAHREEILKQSLETFQGVLKDANFGDLFVGSYRPASLDHLFVSIQTVNSQKLYEQLPEDYYDYIVVDEFHHAAAPTYQALVKKFQPKILLGLTATPERMDGKSILDCFDGRIAAEIRLPEAIDRKLLCPFQYFGVSDTADLSSLRWARGGYDKTELSNLYTLNRAVAERRADNIIASLDRYVTDVNAVIGLGFCVSVEHARFMEEHFNIRGIPSAALTADSSEEERRTAKKRLTSGELKFLFVVDIYNEGVDIPEINTVLFLRPTESLTIFLQQLGRGLRLSEGKDCLTVLDFIGQANRKYDFEEKFAALLSHTNHSVQYEIKHGFISSPKGCYIQLEKKAEEHILENIRSSFSLRSGLISRIAGFEEDTKGQGGDAEESKGLQLTLANFVRYYRLDVRSIYVKYSFARLCAEAHVRPDFQEPAEEILTKAFSRLMAVDSRRWIVFLQNWIRMSLHGGGSRPASIAGMTDGEKRMLQMFYITVFQKTAEDWNSEEVRQNLQMLADSPVMLGDFMELLQYRYDHIDFIDENVDMGFDCPLDLHCSYTRDQLLSAMDFMAPATVREGVKWLPEHRIDVLLVTLNKSDKDYSPTTMYEDYSINESLFHWQSQSTTSEGSETGRRYIEQTDRNGMPTRVALFVREFKEEAGTTAPYTFLGLADYVEHSGSRPMNVIWRLRRPIPAKYLKKTNQLMTG